MFSRLKLSIILFALPLALKLVARRHPAFAARLKQRNLVAQFTARDERIGRWISFRDGRIATGHGMHAKPDVTLSFKNARLGASLLMPPINWLDQVNAQKDFTIGIDGPEDLTNWLAQTLMMMQTAGWKFGVRQPDGMMRYCNMANGGPLFVYVKDGKIVRTTPIEFDDNRCAALDHPGARHEIHAAAQDDAGAARPEQPRRPSIRRTACSTR